MVLRGRADPPRQEPRPPYRRYPITLHTCYHIILHACCPIILRVCCPIILRICYAIPGTNTPYASGCGTGIAYAVLRYRATRAHTVQRYRRDKPYRDTVLIPVLRYRTGVPGGDLAAEVKLLAKFFAGLGLIMYHDEESLAMLVVLNPAEFLIAPATRSLPTRRPAGT
eukprot:1726244-Rhodomonas_salina.1